MDKDFDEYLRISGLGKALKKDKNMNSLMYHDLGIYGEIAEGYIDLLAEEYEVDVEKFNFEEYFPGEFYGKNLVHKYFFLIFPSFRKDFKLTYKPFPVHKISEAIKSKKLI